MCCTRARTGHCPRVVRAKEWPVPVLGFPLYAPADAFGMPEGVLAGPALGTRPIRTPLRECDVPATGEEPSLVNRGVSSR